MQALVHRGDQAQRIVVAAADDKVAAIFLGASAQQADVDIALPLLQRRVDGIVLEHQDAVEQRAAFARACQPLDVRQRHMLVLLILYRLLLNGAPPLPDRQIAG